MGQQQTIRNESHTSHVIAAAIGKKQGICTNAEAAGIGIPASDTSVQNVSIPGPEWVPLFWHRTGSGIGILSVRYRTHRIAGHHSGIPAFTKTAYKERKGYTLHVYTAADGVKLAL